MAMSRRLIFLLLFAAPAWAQTNRYMVFFADKAGTPHAVDQPATFLSARAVQRRTEAGIAVKTEDLPVTPGYVTQVRGTGAKAFFTTRWMNGVLVEADPTQLAAILTLPFVSSTEFVAPNHKLIGGRKKGEATTLTTPAPTQAQLNMLGIDSMHADGFRGEGTYIAVLDSGFPGVDTASPFETLRDEGRILLTQDFITNSADVYQFDSHGTNVLSIMAAAGSGFTGGAPAATYLLFVTEDASTEYRVEEYNWLFAAERADSAGADIIQSSLGYVDFDDPAMDYTLDDLDGLTAVVTRAANLALARGIIVVVSAGNLGGTPWKYISPPADGAGVLAVGAINAQGEKTTFSSIGPPAPATIKPDVVALGEGVTIVEPDGSLSTVSGTSAAAPLVTSLTAGLLQAYPSLNPATLVQHIRNTASQASHPDRETGYGIPAYLAVRNYLEGATGPSVYPNPVEQTLWITFGPHEEPTEFAILDIQGKVVHSASLTEITWANRTTPVDVSGMAAGLYIIRIVSGSLVMTFRFIKL